MDLDTQLPLLAVILAAVLAAQALFLIGWVIARGIRATVRARDGRAATRPAPGAQPIA